MGDSEHEPAIPTVSLGHILQTSPPASVRFALQDPLVGSYTKQIVNETIYCYILPVLLVFGTAGNVLSLIVLCVDKKKDTTNLSLTTLAISDTSYILTTFVRQSSCLMGKFDTVLERNYKYLMYAQMVPINFCFARITGLITAAISTERCLAVLLPLQVRQIITTRRMRICLVFIFPATFILIGPIFFMAESRWVGDPATNASYVRYSYTQWYLENKTFGDNYRDIFLNILFRFLPTVLICFNTVAIIVRLKKASAWRGDTGSTSHTHVAKERKLTIMLVTLCIIFLLCTMPGLVFQIFTYITTEFSVMGRYRNTYSMTSSISLLTQYINSSINFVIYIGLNDRFAKTFRRVCSSSSKFWKSSDDGEKTTKTTNKSSTMTS